MDAERGLVYKEVDGSVTLLRLNPARKLTLSPDSRYYELLPTSKADIVEVGFENEVTRMFIMEAIQGIRFYDAEGNEEAACKHVQFALDNDLDELVRMLAEAEMD